MTVPDTPPRWTVVPTGAPPGHLAYDCKSLWPLIADRWFRLYDEAAWDALVADIDAARECAEVKAISAKQDDMLAKLSTRYRAVVAARDALAATLATAPRVRAYLEDPDWPNDLVTDIDAAIHIHCGDDGSNDAHNDWVHDLANAIVALLSDTPDTPTEPTVADDHPDTRTGRRF